MWAIWLSFWQFATLFPFLIIIYAHTECSHIHTYIRVYIVRRSIHSIYLLFELRSVQIPCKLRNDSHRCDVCLQSFKLSLLSSQGLDQYNIYVCMPITIRLRIVPTVNHHLAGVKIFNKT